MKLKSIKNNLLKLVKFFCTPGYWLNEKMYVSENYSIVPAVLGVIWSICVILFNFVFAEPLHDQYEFWLTIGISLFLMWAGTALAVMLHLFIVRFLYFISSPFASLYWYCNKRIIRKTDLTYLIDLEKKHPFPCVRFFLF